MPIWLYCQSCQQWSKSDASLSKDKACPLCSNLYISLKPVIDSNPYKVKVDGIEQQQDAPQPDEADVNKPAGDVYEEPDSVEAAVHENEPSGEPEKEEIKEEKKAEKFDFVEILETSQAPGTATKTASESDEKKPAEREPAPAVSEASGEEAAQASEEVGEPEKPGPSDTHVIEVSGKTSETVDRPETSDTGDKTQDSEPGDSAPKKRRIRPR